MNGSNKLNLFKEKKIVWEETSSIRISIKRYIYNKLHVYQTNENVQKLQSTGSIPTSLGQRDSRNNILKLLGKKMMKSSV